MIVCLIKAIRKIFKGLLLIKTWSRKYYTNQCVCFVFFISILDSEDTSKENSKYRRAY